MLIPEVLGFKLTGRLPKGTTATDLVLTITEVLRKTGVVGKFVEFYGPGLADLSVADRTTIGNMSPEYGSTIAIFPIDAMTLDYLRLTGRDDVAGGARRGVREGAGAVCDARTRRRRPIRRPSRSISSTVEPSLAGPRRPQDRVALTRREGEVQRRPARPAGGGEEEGRRRGRRRRRRDARPEIEAGMQHGAVVVAAITSCTNTSNPTRDDRGGAAGEEGRREGPLAASRG